MCARCYIDGSYGFSFQADRLNCIRGMYLELQFQYGHIVVVLAAPVLRVGNYVAYRNALYSPVAVYVYVSQAYLQQGEEFTHFSEELRTQTWSECLY